MTHIPAIGQDRAINSKAASYNAVKIQINNPKTNIPEDFCPKSEDNNDYNSVNIEVNDPAVEKEKNSIYDYPESKELVTYNQAMIQPKKLPPLPLPLAYQIINNRTFVNAEFELEEAEKKAEAEKEEKAEVPEPNFTTVDAEKAAPESALSFHGAPEEATETEAKTAFRGTTEETTETENKTAFRGAPEEAAETETKTAFRGTTEEATETEAKTAFRGTTEEATETETKTAFRGTTEEATETEAKTAFRGAPEETDETEAPANNVNFKAANNIEIVPPEEIKPEVDINKVVENLNSNDYDLQAKQIYEIVVESKKDTQKAENYVVTDVFTSLTDIVTKDVSSLEKPDDKTNDLRKKYIINEFVKEQARLNGEDPEKAELPYKISDEEVKSAIKLTDFEMAERNKDYALTALAILAKTYADGVERQSGNTVPLTDLPGVSACVDTLRYGTNPDTKVKAVEALMYISKPEYKDELKSIMTLSAQDKDPAVAMISAAAVQFLDEEVK